MAEVEVQVEVACCSNPGCDQPGTKQCSACKTTPYCGPICQTADWMHHKEECPGHLRKMGMAHLGKARGFERDNNHVQALRFSELALNKLKLLKDRPFDAMDEALTFKTTALRFMGRYREAMESAKERYSLWAMTNIRNPNSIWAAFDLIECCLHIGEFVDAELFARTAYEIINERTDNIIPLDQRQKFLARGAHFLARATHLLAKTGGIAPEAKQATGVKAIALAREALVINTRLFGVENEQVADNMLVLAQILNYFNDVADDEVLRLYGQAKAIFAQVQGSSSPNVAACEYNLGVAYYSRAIRAQAAHDLDRCVANLELALPHCREAVRIYTDIPNQVEYANSALRRVVEVEEGIRQIRRLIATQEAAGASSSSSSSSTATAATAATAAASSSSSSPATAAAAPSGR